MKIILHKDENQGNVLTHALKDLEVLRQKLNGVIVDIESLDLDYLDAYKILGDDVSLDLEEAKKIKIEFIRKERDFAFDEFDKRYIIAVRDESDLTELKAERKKLKDAPLNATSLLENCATLQQIKSISLQDLI